MDMWSYLFATQITLFQLPADGPGVAYAELLDLLLGNGADRLLMEGDVQEEIGAVCLLRDQLHVVKRRAEVASLPQRERIIGVAERTK